MSSDTQNSPTLCFVWAVIFAAVAAVITFFTYNIWLQAFRGPRPITEDELLAIQALQSGNNYVTFRATGPVVDTGLRYGKKGNEGTKYLLTRVGNRNLMISARIDNNDPEFTGSIETISGTEEEAARRLQGQGQLLPVYLQAVRSIWFDSVVALVFIVLGAALAVWMAARGFLLLGRPKPKEDEENPEDNEPPPAFRRKRDRNADADDRLQQKPPRRSEDDY